MKNSQLQIPQTISEIPSLKTTLKILKFCSFLLAHNWRRYYFIGYGIFICLAGFANMYIGSKSIDAIVRNIYIIALLFNSVLRAGWLCWHRFRYEAFMENMRILYVELKELKEDVVNEMLDQTNILTIRVAKLNLTLGFTVVLGFLVYPIFVETRVHAYEVNVPGIDVYASPYYEILFGLQIFFSPNGVCMYIPYTNLFIGFMLFAILMAKVLQHKMRGLNDIPKHRVQSQLIWCIKYHLKFIYYIYEINELATYMHLVEFLLFGSQLCIMLFLFIVVETVGQQIIIIVYIMMIFGQSFVIYYCANELYYQSLETAVAAYDCNWFEFDVETQKYLQLFLFRAQKPCCVLVGNNFPMNLGMLQSLLNAAYSLFTLLKQVYD